VSGVETLTDCTCLVIHRQGISIAPGVFP